MDVEIRAFRSGLNYGFKEGLASRKSMIHGKKSTRKLDRMRAGYGDSGRHLQKRMMLQNFLGKKKS